ncbi:MAG TPA: DUF4142 domain-containing protein [Planctomycetota bacterium]|nr:DUF4142 domain-containing protein [Planctomycetota bacterium]
MHRPLFRIGICSLLALGLAGLGSCESYERVHPRTKSATMDTGDAEVLATLVAVDENEIALAEQARDEAGDVAVLGYADMLHTEHTQHLEATRDLAKTIGVEPALTPEVSDLRQKGDEERETLGHAEGADYDRKYVDAMVKGHQDVLDLIDEHLVAKVSSPALKDHLEETRRHVAHHLERAQELQRALGSPTSATVK